MKDNKQLTMLIREIGIRNTCTKEELLLFLPNYPTLRGHEFIFTIGQANSKKFLTPDVEYFIQGLHQIEMAYKKETNHNFGFGSPSPTAMFIRCLEKTNAQLAATLTKWVADNGGNYYIPANVNQVRPGTFPSLFDCL